MIIELGKVSEETKGIPPKGFEGAVSGLRD